MKNIISAELYKFYKSRAMRISIVLTIIIYVFYALSGQVSKFAYMESGSMSIYTSAVLFSKYIMISSIVFTAIFIAGEYNHGTIRMTIVAGTSRSRYYIVKLFAVMLYITIVFLVAVSSYAVTKTVINGWGSENFIYNQYSLKLIVFISATLINYYVYASFCVMLSFIVQNPASVVGINIGYLLMEYIIASPNNIFQNKILDLVIKGTPGYYMAVSNIYVIEDRILTTGFITRNIYLLVIISIFALIGIYAFKKKSIK